MLKNIYAPLSGGVMQERVMEILANNLANVNTPAFKEDIPSFTSLKADPWPNYKTPVPPAPFQTDLSHLYPLHGNEMEYVALGEVKTAHVQGALRRTDQTTDLAIQGDGFFVIETPFGERLTRDGTFHLTADGTLVTANGHIVQGENGAITGLSEHNLQVLPNGDVFAGNVLRDKIKTVAVEETKLLEKMGENMWVHNGNPDNVKAATGEVRQYHIEASTVNPLTNVSQMIISHRTYEALQKAIKSHDETMQNANRLPDLS